MLSYNIIYATLGYITYARLCYITFVMLRYITYATLCYMTYATLYNICYVLLYNISNVMLYNICNVLLYDIYGVANLYGLRDWVGMAPCMGPMSPLRACSTWAGLCPEKLVKTKTKNLCYVI